MPQPAGTERAALLSLAKAAHGEKRLMQIRRMVAKAMGEDDFWEDHLATFEIAARLGRTLPATACDLAELRRRGVLLSHGAAFAEADPPGGSTTCWHLDESPRPRPYRRSRSGALPVRLLA